MFSDRRFEMRNGTLLISTDRNDNKVYLIPKGLVFPQNLRTDPYMSLGHFGHNGGQLRLKIAKGVIKIRLENPEAITEDDEAYIFDAVGEDFEKRIISTEASLKYGWKKINLRDYINGENKSRYVSYGQDTDMLGFEPYYAFTSPYDRRDVFGLTNAPRKINYFSMYLALKNNPFYAPVFGIANHNPREPEVNIHNNIKITIGKDDNIELFVRPGSCEHYHFSGLTDRKAEKQLADETEGMDDDEKAATIQYMQGIHATAKDIQQREYKERVEALEALAEELKLEKDEYLQVISGYHGRACVVLANRFSKELTIKPADDMLKYITGDILSRTATRGLRGEKYFRSKDQEVVAIIHFPNDLFFTLYTQDPDVLSGLFGLPDDALKLHFIEDVEEVGKLVNETSPGIVFFEHYVEPIQFNEYSKDYAEDITDLLETRLEEI